MSAFTARRAGVVVLGLVVVAGVAFLVQRDSGSAPAAPLTCNGSERLCALRLDEVSLATTHNAMNAAASGSAAGRGTGRRSR